MKRTTKTEIIKTLAKRKRPLAIHEIYINARSQNNIATRLSEMAARGILDSKYRDGERFKEWWLILPKDKALGRVALKD